MTDRPIIFSGPMVRALLAGRKTQTRRVLKPKRGARVADCTVDTGPALGGVGRRFELPVEMLNVPYATGDRLWVREAWRVSKRWDGTPPRDLEPHTMSVVMEAGGSIANEGDPPRWTPSDWPHGQRPDWIGKFRQGMHMPRWASRLTLTVTDVRVERLQEISEDDAEAEGIEPHRVIVDVVNYGRGPVEIEDTRWYFDGCDPEGSKTAGDAFAGLWNSINGPDAWTANPWVAAISFEVERRNIDEVKP